MKLYDSIRQKLLNSDRSFRDRVFVTLTVSALVMAFVAIVGDLIYGDNILEIIVLLITIIITPMITYLGLVKNRVELATRLISMGILFFIMPGVFIFGGGPRGGAVPWLVFSYLYIGLLLSGKWRGISMLLLSLEVGLLYYFAYHFPELVHAHGKKIFFVDSALGVVEVGVVCFIMTRFQSWLLMEENRKAKEEAKKFEELNRTQNRFFSSMSHEIRTPINSILGLNEIILRQEDASEEIIRDAGNIQGAGRMLLALINDILDISKIEAGKMEIVPVNYSMASLISEIVNMMWLRAEQKGLKLVVEADPYLPSELFGDEVRIKQILINLLNNAVKYTKEGTVTLHIEVEETKGNQVELVFSVSDTGIGIKQDVLPVLFNAFQRVDEEKNRKIEGTGLGLSIVKQLVELMGGEITVDSVYTQGSTFIVTLWQTMANAGTIGNLNITNYGSVENGKRYDVSFTAPEAKVLIVDDNEMNLEVEKKLLEGTHMQIDTAVSGVQAISLCLAHRYDMIFMDHLMPEMDGIQCMQRLRKQVGGRNNHAPIIALTANAGSENRELYNRSGFDGYLVKPVSGQQLEDMLLAYLPENKVSRIEGADTVESRMDTAKGYSRKIPVLITTSSMCDLPREVLKDNQIDVIPFTINANGKEYCDGTEVSTEELLRYRKAGVELSSRPPTVEEFERFFGDELKKAHQVIYLTVASEISREYEAAMEAAKAYGNVYVFNSGYNSASLGMLVLSAYLLSTRGKNPGVIIEELETLKRKVHCSFITDDSSFLVKRGMMARGLHAVMNTFGFRPLLKVEDNMFRLARIISGDLRASYEKYINYALPWNANPDLEVLMISYVDLSDEDMIWLAKEIRKLYNFKHIVFQRASAAMSLNCGLGAFGILYFEKGDYPSQLGDFFETDAESSEEDEAFMMREDHNADPFGTAVEGVLAESGSISGMIEGASTESGMIGGASAERGMIGDVSAGTGAAGGAFAGTGTVGGAFAGTGAVGGAFTDQSSSDRASIGEKAEEWYHKIPGLDGDAALRNSGSEESLRMVLEIFFNAIDMKVEELNGFFDGEDWENYTIKVHALKSSSRLIGAIELADEAEALEFAGKDSDIDFIRAHHAPMIEHFLGYKEPLATLFGKTADGFANPIVGFSGTSEGPGAVGFANPIVGFSGTSEDPGADDITDPMAGFSGTSEDPGADGFADPIVGFSGTSEGPGAGGFADPMAGFSGTSEDPGMDGFTDFGEGFAEAGSDSDMEEEFDASLMESIYESLREAAAEGDTGMISGIFAEMADYPLPERYRETMDRLKAGFENDDLNGMLNMIEEAGNE